MVPLTVIISPAFALAMAVFKADSVVTVVLVSVEAERSDGSDGSSWFFAQPAKRITSAARALRFFFIL